MAPLQELSRSHKVLDHGQMVKDGLLLIAAASNDNTSDGNADDSMPSLPPTPPLDDSAPSLPPLAPDESAPSMPPLSPPSIPPMSMDHSSKRDESSPWRMTGMFLAVVGLGAFLLICILNAAAAWAESAWDEGAWGETAWAAADTIIHKGGTSLEGGKGKQSPEHFAASTYLDLRSRIESTKDEEALLQRETRIGLLATSQSSHQGPTDKAVEDTSVVNDSVEPVDDDEPADEEEHVDPTSLPEEHLGLLFQRIALSQPHRMAIRTIDGTLQLTYGALLASVCLGAQELQRVGLGSGDLVGLMISCSVEGCVGILSIVFAGGAYVPLDPSYPREWLSQVIGGAQLQLIMISPSYSEEARLAAMWLGDSFPEVKTIKISLADHDADRQASMQESTLRKLHSTGTDRTLVTVLFTSGSTGRPKGVPGFEAGVLAGARFFTTTFPYAEDEVVCNHITYGWVDHKMELWHGLLLGKELVVVPSTEELIRMVDRPPKNVFKLWAVPTLLEAIFGVLEQRKEQGTDVLDGPPPFLSLVVATGEALTPTMVERYRALVPNGTIVSSYGLTETQGETSVAIYGPSRPVLEQVSIGSPHAPYSYGIRSLDTGEWMKGVGDQGELFIAGPLILSGYYTRADGVCLADESANARFSVAAPELWPGNVAHQQEQRPVMMYQTGDLVAIRENGEVQHLGRCDDQVKVNGVRTELGTISASALKCNAVQAAFAVAVADVNGKTRVVLAVTPTMPTDMIMKELAGYLPSIYMPAKVISLPTLPTLPNGKIDRKALKIVAAEALAVNTAPLDSITRLLHGKDQGMMPCWYYVILHMIFFGMFEVIGFHLRNTGGVDFTSRAWYKAIDAFDGVGLIFFASGYYDLVAAPPKSCVEALKRLGGVAAVYVVYHLLQSLPQGPFSLADLWPVLALLIYRCICWPLQLLASADWAPSWAGTGITIVLAGAAFTCSTVCYGWMWPGGYSTFQCVEWKVDPGPLEALGFSRDLFYLVLSNRVFWYFSFYALQPTLFECVWGRLWQKQKRKDGIVGMICEPHFHRRLLSAGYIVCFFTFNMTTFVSDTSMTTHEGTVVLILLYHGLFAALFHLLPTTSTPLSAIGTCSFTLYAIYMSWFERNLTLPPFYITQRFVVMGPDKPALELLAMLGLISLTMIACSFSFGLTAPVKLPEWALALPCFKGQPLPTAIRLPKLIFPCSWVGFVLSWIVIVLGLEFLPPRFIAGAPPSPPS